MKQKIFRTVSAIAAILLVVSLYLLAITTRNTKTFSRLHDDLLILVLICVILLLTLITVNLGILIRQFWRHVPGAKLTARLFGLFTLVAFIPLVVVYFFSIQFISRGIDSWFNLDIGRDLHNALTLSRTALDHRIHGLLVRTRQAALALSGTNPQLISFKLDELRSRVGATNLTVFSSGGRIIAFSSSTSVFLVPQDTNQLFWLAADSQRAYVGLTTQGHKRLYAQALVPFANPVPWGQPWILQAWFRLPRQENRLTLGVRNSYARYEKLRFFRAPLKLSFILTLTLVLLLSLLAAASGALYAARRLVAPIQSLIEGFRSVARGDLGVRLPLSSRDDWGFLSHSFNAMAQKLADAQAVAHQSQSQIERERFYLETVLSRLTSGVIVLDNELKVSLANDSAVETLKAERHELLGQFIAGFAAWHPELSEFVSACIEAHRSASGEFQREIAMSHGLNRRILLMRAASLTVGELHTKGTVIVFDDVTSHLQSQRDAAWGEVARRLAHEIKNPLTPIQLAAERIQRRYQPLLDVPHAEDLAGLTATIIQQVEAMKRMVNAFSEYARSPDIHITRFDLNQCIGDIAELYREQSPSIEIALELSEGQLWIEADQARILQILHNLLKNSVEALHSLSHGHICVTTRMIPDSEEVELSIEDNGAGFSPVILEHAFEPYVTSKRKGTGLGLAIVKKLIEELGGYIYLANRNEGGAQITLTLPINDRGRDRSLLAQARGYRIHGQQS
ncbi:nitrogen regulation protein NtrY [mine drainage metagenome]|uniref:histidine kinase n=1 Tax=mine drainage metagenome TaxID=410659 RepID=T1A052_9ZZZZ